MLEQRLYIKKTKIHFLPIGNCVTGQAQVLAKDWIKNYVTLEAKSLLNSTDKFIKEISDELNFESQSIFGKYFKRNIGIPPKEYKKETATTFS